jgi:hypothetical protein
MSWTSFPQFRSCFVWNRSLMEKVHEQNQAGSDLGGNLVNTKEVDLQFGCLLLEVMMEMDEDVHKSTVDESCRRNKEERRPKSFARRQSHPVDGMRALKRQAEIVVGQASLEITTAPCHSMAQGSQGCHQLRRIGVWWRLGSGAT